MEFFEAIQARRSCRVYTPEPVPELVIHKALDAALIAPTSSNMQPWEFYWVRSPEQKKRMATACLSQSAARTAQELVVCVARIDTWKRNRRMMLAEIKQRKLPDRLRDYYQKLVPFVYAHGPLSLFAPFKWLFLNCVGMFKPMVRGPVSDGGSWNVAIKTCALACENFMLAIYAQGFACCPMEGFDEVRVKKILGLNWTCGARVVMVISVGKKDPTGIWGDQFRFDKKNFVFEI